MIDKTGRPVSARVGAMETKHTVEDE